MQAACHHVNQSCNNTYMYRSTFVAKMWANADQQTIDQHPAPENGRDLTNNQYEIIWFEGLQFPDTLVPDTEDAHVKMTMVLWYNRQTRRMVITDHVTNM